MLSNTAVPRYYGKYREHVMRGEIPVCKEISMEMARTDELIRNPGIYYDDEAIDGFIRFCENELTLTDGSDVEVLESFKLWAESAFAWYYYVDKSVWVSDVPGRRGHYETVRVKKRLRNKQYIIVARGGAKSMYASFVQSYFLNIDTTTTHQIVTAPTVKQAEETLGPMRTAITRARGPLYKFLTEGSKMARGASKVKLASTKRGVENFMTGSLVEPRPMRIDKVQGLRCKVATVDEWLSGDIREDVVGALEQGASKIDDYFILAISSEGTVRNSVGDSIKMELMSILTGEYDDPHTSIWYYKLDDVKEVAHPELWVKAQPNIGITVSYETYQRDVARAEAVPAVRNDILAKRFGIPMEGYTYFFTYEETLPHSSKEFWQMPCALGCDLSRGDDFCAFTFIFPLERGDLKFGVKTRCYITEDTLMNLPSAGQVKYEEFIREGSLVIMPGVVLDMDDVFDELCKHIDENEYDIRAIGYDPYNAKGFINRWETENGPYGIEKVIQGARTESVPLGELKHLAEGRRLLFDQSIMQYCMGNCIVLQDTNGNRKLYKRKHEEKIDAVAAMMDAFVAWKVNRNEFE